MARKQCDCILIKCLQVASGVVIVDCHQKGKNHALFIIYLSAFRQFDRDSALADWTLDPTRSHLNFVSIKANNVAEINTFANISGHVSDSGQVVIRLPLDSVETLIPIRNERMRQFLFETSNYQEAVLRAQFDPQVIAGLAVGALAQVTAESSLLLHGQAQPLTLALQVAKLNAETLLVVSIKPVIVDAAIFGMTARSRKVARIGGIVGN